MVLYLVNYRSHAEWNVVVIALVILLQEINAYSTKKQLQPLEEYGEHTNNLMEHGHKDDKMVESEFVDNSYGNYLIQNDIMGHGQVEGRRQNRLERSVIDVDANKENVIDNLKLASSYPPRMAQSMGFWQQDPIIARRTFRALPGRRMEFVDPSLIHKIPLQQYYRFNTPSEFYNMHRPIGLQRRSARPNIGLGDPSFGYRNSKYAVGDDSYPSKTSNVGLDHNANSDIFEDDVRPADSFEPLGRKQRKLITYRLVPVTTAEAQRLKQYKHHRSPLETGCTTAKPCAQGNEGAVIEEQNKPSNVNETKPASTKTDKGSVQYQVIPKPCNCNTTKEENTTLGTDEGKKKNMLKEIISELEEFKPHSISNSTEIRDNVPCSILGSWISEAGGVRFDIEKSPMNGMLNVTIANTIPPSSCPWLNKTQWRIDGEIPLTDRGVFTLTAIHKVRHKLATFVGQCMRCNGEELVAGVWSTGRTARDCRDTIVSYGEKPDVLHKEVLHLLRAQRRKELEERVNEVATTTPATECAKAASKGWWEY